ncbi:hypothetical protein IFM89_035597 [Coptis chinensis]|uniref:Prolamin-like domain-containing protein n=1 Tax=Coptis chinensis TaxID=261450 RepID=A0A835HZ22_9MAGN|nr:hypothetical protein IFM89_035597 [Coptis chinensis]
MGAIIVSANKPLFRPGHNLKARLYGEGGGDCWNAVLQLKSYTSEIIIFFLDGEAYLGIPCCRAIRIITRNCWPVELGSAHLLVGFVTVLSMSWLIEEEKEDKEGSKSKNDIRSEEKQEEKEGSKSKNDLPRDMMEEILS